MCRNSTEYGRICINHEEQHQTDLHRVRTELDARSNGFLGFSDCQLPAEHANIDTHCQLSQDPGENSERNDKRHQNQSTRIFVHQDQGATLLP